MFLDVILKTCEDLRNVSVFLAVDLRMVRGSDDMCKIKNGTQCSKELAGEMYTVVGAEIRRSAVRYNLMV